MAVFRCFERFLAICYHGYMYGMMLYALQTYHRDHIMLNFRQIGRNRCFRSILDLVKIVKTHWVVSITRRGICQ